MIVLLAWLFSVAPAPVKAANQPPQVTCTYDQPGRLVGVRDLSGSMATYRYDAVGKETERGTGHTPVDLPDLTIFVFMNNIGALS